MNELINEVEHVISFAKKVLQNSISGSLYVKRQGGVRYFERDRGETVGKYLGKGDRYTIKQLEEKAYYTQLLKVAEKEAESLEKAKRILDTMPNYKSVFLSIPLEKRHLISPYEYSPKEKDEVVRFSNKKPVKEEIKLITQNGEHVRSKSELIIADRFMVAGVPYYYEDPLILVDEDKAKGALTPCLYWHPDFRVQNIRTGKQYYWEHFGMLDNPEYCDACQRKLEIYAKYGYFPGENLIITSESSEHGLNLEYVDCLIEKYLK